MGKVKLTGEERRFLSLLAGTPAPHVFEWMQRDDDGRLKPATGHPDKWTHFRARTNSQQATISEGAMRKLEADGMFDGPFIVSPAGLSALEDEKDGNDG